MKPLAGISLLICLGLPLLSQAETATVNGLLQHYANQGAGEPSAQRGQEMWNRRFPGGGDTSSRSCASCHTSDLTTSGEHIRTGKTIKPLSPSVNPERLTSSKDIEKWFLRNCKWTLGRECNPQEKSDFLVFINEQNQ